MAVDTQHPDYVRWAPEWRRIRDVVEGQTAMQEHADCYLRFPEGLSAKERTAYAKAADFYDATSRTVEGLTGMAFLQDPIITVPASMEPIRDDMTLDGVAVEGFADKLFEEVLLYNRAGVLIDFPKEDPKIRSKRDAELANRRPYASIVSADRIFYWRTVKVNGVRQLGEVRYFTTVTTASSEEFEEECEEAIRVLQLNPDQGYVMRLFVKATDKERFGEKRWIERGDPEIPEMNGKPLPFIPFWFVNSRDLSDAVLKPSLLGLANANISHFKTTAQYENALSFCGAPQPYITGYQAVEGESFKIGSSEAWCIANENAEVGYLTIGSDGISELRMRLVAIEQQMAMLGARMLSPDKNGVEAAETAKIHRQGEISVVIAACNRVSLALTEILRFMGEWGGMAGSSTSEFKIQTNFFETVMQGAEAVALVSLWQKGVIAFSDLLANLKRGQLVAPDRTEEEIASENESGLITPYNLMLGAGLGPQPVDSGAGA